MAKNSGSSSNRTTAANDWRRFMNLCAYIAIICVGVCLLLSKIGIFGSFATALSIIAHTIAYIIVAIGGWFYIANKRNVWLYVTYFVALVLIIVCYFL